MGVASHTYTHTYWICHNITHIYDSSIYWKLHTSKLENGYDESRAMHKYSYRIPFIFAYAQSSILRCHVMPCHSNMFFIAMLFTLSISSTCPACLCACTKCIFALNILLYIYIICYVYKQSMHTILWYIHSNIHSWYTENKCKQINSVMLEEPRERIAFTYNFVWNENWGGGGGWQHSRYTVCSFPSRTLRTHLSQYSCLISLSVVSVYTWNATMLLPQT